MHIFFSGAKAVFLFERDDEETVMGATIEGSLKIEIDLSAVKISGSASFSSVNNETEKDNKLKVSFHGDYLLGMLTIAQKKRNNLF